MPDQAFLDRLDQPAREALEAVSRHRRFDAGQVLFSEEDEGRDVYILVEGIVKVITTSRIRPAGHPRPHDRRLGVG